ncbi:Inherit from opiNOG: protein Hydra magnipapillata [Seminavis robusta]|uniref:Inherit from opiNOG: protein Hydra magnipapillata n=1 Tax=Seminavis robusta TaxID=568900 RepID=A0A9N8F4W8_9STRA|nr:Inherit from opiNOG: protein Hydra magnipapillata [Seminavis robusta]|eukprot:Sro3803_g351200.1 Inherit from opiNOG: protein Hydra magnipapillata (132) ;mRNA; r:1688-2247
MFAVTVEKRDSDTLLPLILKFIKPGSIIRSDHWKVYFAIEYLDMDLGDGLTLPLYQWEGVNHSKHFKDPVTQVHTNTIEGTWNGIKRMVPVHKRTTKQVQGCLFEFIWRRANEGNLWNGLLAALRDVKYDY